jgi:hypothetical protein
MYDKYDNPIEVGDSVIIADGEDLLECELLSMENGVFTVEDEDGNRFVREASQVATLPYAW